jgi:tripeptide aminopeptidase
MIVHLPSNVSDPKKSLFFDAHVDTVEPGLGVKPVVDGDVVRSDGTTILGADDKSGVAAMIVALEELVKPGAKHGDLYFLFTSAEEIGLAGVTHLDFKNIKADYGYILDSHGPIGGVIVAAPYHYHYDIRVKGRASHAGIAPDKGISAIKIASRIVSRLPQGRLDRETVANIGLIDGGKATNIVAEECAVKGEYRSLDRDKPAKVENIVRRIVDRFGKGAVSIETTFEKLYDGFAIDRDSDFIRLTDAAVRGIGIEPRYEKTNGGSNTNIYNQNGIPSLTLASGMEDLHSTKEYIRIDDLENLTKLILKLAELA